MNFKKIAKKWGAYALGIMAVTGGMVATNAITDNSIKVSASSFDDYFVTDMHYLMDQNQGNRILSIDTNTGYNYTITVASSLYMGDYRVYSFSGATFHENLKDVGEYSMYLPNGASDWDRPGLYWAGTMKYNGNESSEYDEGILYFDDEGRLTFNLIKMGDNEYIASDYSNGVLIDYNKLFGESYTQEDVDNAYAEGQASVDITVDNQESYDQGYEAGLDSVNSSVADSQGKYIYFFKTDDGFGNSSYSTYIISEETESNIIKLKQFFNVQKDSDYTYYSNREYIVDIDNYLKTGTLKYEDLIINGDDNTTTSSETYHWFENIAFYSPSNNLTDVFNKMSAGQIRSLTEAVINIIKDNEWAGLNDTSIMDGLTINMEHMQFETFGTIDENEESFSYVYNGNINLQLHPHDSNTYEVTRRAYDDTMYGTYGNGYSEEEMQDKYDQGFNDGKESVDITSDNQDVYDEAYQEGFVAGESSVDITINDMDVANTAYGKGYEDGMASVDITTDNEEAINQYITDNNMKTEAEYNAYGESQYEAGADSVDITTDNESAINQYITDNNMKTEAEYNAYGESQYKVGAESVDITSNDKAVFDKGYAEGAESVDITTDNEEVYNTAYDEGYDDNKFWKQVGRLFSNIGSLFVNAWTGVKGWFR